MILCLYLLNEIAANVTSNHQYKLYHSQTSLHFFRRTGEPSHACLDNYSTDGKMQFRDDAFRLMHELWEYSYQNNFTKIMPVIQYHTWRLLSVHSHHEIPNLNKNDDKPQKRFNSNKTLNAGIVFFLIYFPRFNFYVCYTLKTTVAIPFFLFIFNKLLLT